MKVKKLDPSAIIPTYGSAAAAGCDLYSVETVFLNPGEIRLIHTGWAMEIPTGYWGGIYARSGLALKKGLRPANCVGVIDSDYRGEIMVALRNDSYEGQWIEKGDRIAQLIFQQTYRPINGFEEVDELSDTERASGGFGSTGTK